MKSCFEIATTIMAIVTWLMGIVIAHGFWSALFSISFPPYAWYLVVERMMAIRGIV